MSLIENVSRRHFLSATLSTSAFVLAAQVLPRSAFAQDPAVRTRAQGAALNPSVYLGIETDGRIYIITHRSEMGTCIRTTLPLVAADELDDQTQMVEVSVFPGESVNEVAARIRQAGGDLVLYYGSPRAEMRRLRAAGFRAVETVPGKLSPRLERFGPLARRLADAWPYYVARK